MRSTSIWQGGLGCSTQCYPLTTGAESRFHNEALVTLVERKHFTGVKFHIPWGTHPQLKDPLIRAKPFHSRECNVREEITTLHQK